MSPWRAAWRIVLGLRHVFVGLRTIATQFDAANEATRQALVQAWSVQLLQLLGVELRTVGRVTQGGMVVANHISWLDIVVMNAANPVRFVSKSDVKAWPLVGKLIVGAGTLFIERASRRDAMRVVHQIAGFLSEGKTVAVFPEGTTGDGKGLLPFHANLFQAAIAADAQVWPVGIRFTNPGTGEISMAPAYIGDDTLVGSIWRTLRRGPVLATVTVGEPQRCQNRDRRAWARHMQTEVAQLIGQ
ncbi:MAG: 1-acyl-sn-glycerol-3-phosphate acyltransferase [Burkholderiaceae bacterium]|nr:1-acyl-sn-glycerol-3-phosphate acyltransferase [Burkholderiaceae bacterium]